MSLKQTLRFFFHNYEIMVWHKSLSLNNKISKDKFSYRDHSIVKKLRSEYKSNSKFEVMVNNLNLEELIALKLELAYRSTCSRLFYLPLLDSARTIMIAAIIKFAISVANSKREAGAILRKEAMQVSKLAYDLGVFSYFKEQVPNPVRMEEHDFSKRR